MPASTELERLRWEEQTWALAGDPVTKKEKGKLQKGESILRHTSKEGLSVSSPMVLNLLVVTPLGVTYQISCISDIYITIHNSSKITVMK